MNPAIVKLNEYLDTLSTITEFESLEAKVEHIGLMNQIKSSIGQLRLCEQHGINAGSLVSTLPKTDDLNVGYLAVYENESSNPCNWEEVIFDGRQILLVGGDLVIRK